MLVHKATGDDEFMTSYTWFAKVGKTPRYRSLISKADTAMDSNLLLAALCESPYATDVHQAVSMRVSIPEGGDTVGYYRLRCDMSATDYSAKEFRKHFRINKGSLLELH